MEIQSVLLLHFKNRHALWSMLKSAYPPQIKRGVSVFIYPPAQSFLGISDSPGQYLNTVSIRVIRLHFRFYHSIIDLRMTLRALWVVGIFLLIMSSWIRLPASAVWSVCSQRFHYNSKDAIISRAGGSANIIMHQWFLSLKNLHFSIFLSEGSVLQKRRVVQKVSWVFADWSSNAFIYLANSVFLFLGWFMTLLFPPYKWRTSFHTDLLFQKMFEWSS